MIYKIICTVLIAILIIRAMARIRDDLRRPAPAEQEHDSDYICYSEVDEMAEIRERLKILEDLISTCESYSVGEHEKSFRISWHDMTGNNHYDAFVSAEFIDYLYAERIRLRCALRKKIASIQN